MTAEELKVIITAQTKDIINEINKVKKDLGSMDKEATKSNESMTNSFKKVASVIASLGIAKQILDIGKASIQSASDLQEVQNVVNVAFGSMSDDVEAFAKNALSTIGMSEKVAKEYSSNFMSMATSMGINAESGKNMSLQLTALAGDMASFYNVEQSVAKTALNSVFTGETESLKKFGVVLTETNLKEYALTQGITKNISKMSQSELVALRYKYVLEKTSLAQGDFSRTSDNWANQLRVLNGTWEELKTTLGISLIQALTPTINTLFTILTYVNEITKAFSDIMGWKLDDDNNESVTSSFESAKTNVEDTTDAVKELKSTMMGIDELNVVSKDSNSNTSNSSSGTVGELNDISEYSNVTTKSLDGIKEKAKEIAEDIKEFWDKYGKSIIDGILSVFVGIASVKVGSGIVSFVKYMKSAFDSSTGIEQKMAGIGLIVGGLTLEHLGIENLASALNGGDKSLGASITELISGGASTIIGGAMIGGPIGALIAGLGYLVVGILEYADAEREYIRESTIQSVLDNNKTSVEELNGAIHELFKPYDDYIEEQKELNEKLETAEDDFDKAKTEASKFFSYLETREEITSEDLDTLTTILGDLFETSQNLLDVHFDTIFSGLYSAINNTIGAEARANIADMVDVMKDLQEQINTARGALNSEASKIIADARANGNVLTQEQKERLSEITTTLVGSSFDESFMDDKETAKRKTNELLSAGITADNFESYSKTINDTLEYFNGLYEQIDLAADTQIGSVKYVQSQAQAYGIDTSGIDFSEYETVLRGNAETLKNEVSADLIDFLVSLYKSVKADGDEAYSKIINGDKTFGDYISASLYTGIFGDWSGNTDKERIERADEASQPFYENASKIIEFINKLKLKGYAVGGFPSVGELFIARESGAEMVGSIGGRTAVANNQQIENAIASAVYNAIVSANSGNGNNQPINVNVYLDGKKIESSDRTIRQSRGTTIATGGVVNYA